VPDLQVARCSPVAWAGGREGKRRRQRPSFLIRGQAMRLVREHPGEYLRRYTGRRVRYATSALYLPPLLHAESGILSNMYATRRCHRERRKSKQMRPAVSGARRRSVAAVRWLHGRAWPQVGGPSDRDGDALPPPQEPQRQRLDQVARYMPLYSPSLRRSSSWIASLTDRPPAARARARRTS
jgi:hypothetical protein